MNTRERACEDLLQSIKILAMYPTQSPDIDLLNTFLYAAITDKGRLDNAIAISNDIRYTPYPANMALLAKINSIVQQEYDKYKGFNFMN